MNKDGIITHWELYNFQSISETAMLHLKPLTIFSGPNSSGKSAVIKSILMVAQSLGSPAREVPLVLDGEYTKLGDFDHILHHGSDEMELRFVIKQQEGKIDVWTNIEADSISPTSMRVTTSSVKWGDSDEESFELKHIPRIQLLPGEKQRMPQILREQINQGLFNYEIIKPEGLESSLLYETTVSASLTNFLPGRALRRVQSEIRRVTIDIEQAIEGLLSEALKRPTSITIDWDKKLDGLAQPKLFREALKANPFEASQRTLENILNLRNTLTIRDLTDIVKNLPTHEIKDLANRMRGALPDVQEELNNLASFQKTELEAREFPYQYSQIIQQIRRVFRNQIFYLGPLRDDPRTIYARPPQSNQRDVGLKGEYAAAMLDVYKNTDVNYPEPPKENEEFNGTYTIQEDKLPKAVEVWLERMGLAESFDTSMVPRVGYQLDLRPSGVKKDLDLTSLGVGVSQVLPAIVMALLAPEDSVLIFEQPEVHLHPKVQSVLGDFFLGIVQCDKQCIVETHSEYLIQRLRRRIAESSDETIRERLGIYFVKLEDGVSQFEPVEPNEYGAILEWPEGFFDEAEKESSELVTAAMNKRLGAIG